MKIVYVVTGSGGNKYSVMTRISIATLRISNPAVEIVIATDQDSLQSMKVKEDRLLVDADHVLEIATPAGSSAFKSRFIKTRLGMEIKGLFVFLDSDTVVRKKLDFQYDADFAIAAARNHSRYKLSEQIWEGDLAVFNKMNWEVPPADYLNSGVILYSGTNESRRLSERWHSAWMKTYECTGAHQDQPSLNHLLYTEDFPFYILPNPFNAQIKSRLHFVNYQTNPEKNEKLDWDAVIWHYFMSENQKIHITAFEILVQKVFENGTLADEAIQQLIRAKHPWIRESVFDDLVAKRISTIPRLKGLTLTWLEGKRREAITAWFKKAIGIETTSKL